VSEIHIVEGDLESFAKTVRGIPGERLNSVDGETSLREATLGMPGSDSKAYAAGYGAAVNEECKKASAGFKKFKEMPAAATDISTTQFATSNIYRQDNEVHVNDVPDGTLVQVYTLDGQLISEVTVHNTGAVLPLNTENPVIVRAGRQTVKLR